jgi:hypothetical protein
MELNRVTLEEFVLDPKESVRIPDRCQDEGGNIVYFVIDIKDGKLDNYEGTYVAYWHGNLYGQSSNGRLLQREASKLYDGITVFKVPDDLDEIKALKSFQNEDILAKCKYSG